MPSPGVALFRMTGDDDSEQRLLAGSDNRQHLDVHRSLMHLRGSKKSSPIRPILVL